MKYRYVTNCFEVEHKGQTLRGKILKPTYLIDSSIKPVSGPFHCVIICHGFGETYNDYMSEARFLAEHGIMAVLFDMRGTHGGESDGSVLNKSVLTEAQDIETVIKFFQKDQDVLDIFLLGYSEGGFNSAIAASGIKDIAGMVLFYPAFVIPEFVRQTYPDKEKIPEITTVLKKPVGRRYFTDIYELNPWKSVADGHSHPCLILHGSHDRLVPSTWSETAVEKMDQTVLVKLEGENHGFNEINNYRALEVAMKYILAEANFTSDFLKGIENFTLF